MIIGGAMQMMTKLARKAVSSAMAAAFAMMLALALAPTGAAAGACANQIKSCGCTINSPGMYLLAGPNPMKSTAGTCIDITASNVTLQSGSTIQGPGSTTSTVGVHIEPSANNVFLNYVVARDFGKGIRIDGYYATTVGVITTLNNKGLVVNGKNALLTGHSSEADEAVGIEVNATATNFVMVGGDAGDSPGVGIELNGVSGAVLSTIGAGGNGTFGIWLNSASDNVISYFDVEDNGIAGVYLGCNAAGPNGKASCPAGQSPSNGNSLIGATYMGFNIYANNYSYADNILDQSYGIAVGLGNLDNDFIMISGTGNVVDDALDENPNCGSNRWLLNTFTTSSPPPNTAYTCLN
jgi:hypothetical protein